MFILHICGDAFIPLPTGGVPPSRWVVNFDFDLLDGLVLAAVLGAHAPFLVSMVNYYYYYVIFRSFSLSSVNRYKHDILNSFFNTSLLL